MGVDMARPIGPPREIYFNRIGQPLQMETRAAAALTAKIRRVGAEVVVVGAGIMGSATAYALARDGHDVRLLEQFRVGHARGSSHGRSRIVRLAYPEVELVELAKESFAGWRTLEQESCRELLELNGYDHEVVSGVTLIETPGHSAGHLSVVVRAADYQE